MDPRPVASGAPSSRLVLDFQPARDGFGFANHFTWRPADLSLLERRLRPLTMASLGLAGAAGGALAAAGLGALAGGAATAGLAASGGADGLVRAAARRWPSFGLCGGMSLTAIQRWSAQGRVPTSRLERDPLRPLLRRNQEATLRASLLTFARLWLRVRLTPGAVPDAPLATELARELDRIEQTIRAGRPVLTGLVGDAPDPFALHQVVVFGIERSDALTARLDVYDPNAPGATRTIHTAPAPAPGRTRLRTDMRTGPLPGGGAHISTRPGHLSHVFAIDV